MTRTDENKLGIFERKALRSIFGEILKNGVWLRRTALKLYRSYNEPNFIKRQKIKWAGHVIKLEKDRTTKRVFNARPVGTRKKGRSNLRWIDGLEKDLQVLQTKNWRNLARRRLALKKLLEKAKAHSALSSN